MSGSLLMLAAAPGWKEVVSCPTFWGLLAAVIGLYLVVPPHTRRRQVVGGLVAIVGLLLIIGDQVHLQWPVGSLAPHVVFWLLAGVAIFGGVGMISAQSPIYSAMWFALSLLGVAALFLQQDAQFLGVATMIVYAGAIVVTFLFVLMLAQPEGHSTADRISWGVLPKLAGVIVAGALVGMVSQVIHPAKAVAAATAEGEEAPPLATPQAKGSLRDQLEEKFPELAGHLADVKVDSAADDSNTVTLLFRDTVDVKVADADIAQTLQPVIPNATIKRQLATSDVQADRHMAHLGGYLFSRHLIAVELAGTLLLAALVGAVGMVIQGRLSKEGAAHE